MTERSSTIASLIRDAEAAADKQIDPLLVLKLLLKFTIESEADPYLFLGMLTEAIATAVVQRIPDEKQREVGLATAIMLRNQLSSKGVL